MTQSDPLPTFTTARLIVRAQTLADLEDCLAMDRDPLVTKFIHGPWTDPITHRVFVEKRASATHIRPTWAIGPS